MARRRKYISVLTLLGAASAIDALGGGAGLPAGRLNNMANAYRTSLGSYGVPNAGPLGALACLAIGGVGSQVANGLAPGAKIPLGRYGVKL